MLTNHFFSVKCVAWAPHELGAILAWGYSDGKVSIHEYKGKSTKEKKEKSECYKMINT